MMLIIPEESRVKSSIIWVNNMCEKQWKWWKDKSDQIQGANTLLVDCGFLVLLAWGIVESFLQNLGIKLHELDVIWRIHQVSHA